MPRSRRVQESRERFNFSAFPLFDFSTFRLFDFSASVAKRGTRAPVPVEQVHSAGVLEDFGRGRVTRVHLRQPGGARIVHEVDPKQSAQTGPGGQHLSGAPDLLRCFRGQLNRTDRAAIRVRRRAAATRSHKLAGDADQERLRRSGQIQGGNGFPRRFLLEVVRFAECSHLGDAPVPDAHLPPGCAADRLAQPAAVGRRRIVFRTDAQRRQLLGGQHAFHTKRISHDTEHVRRVSPQRTVLRDCGHDVRVVLQRPGVHPGTRRRPTCRGNQAARVRVYRKNLRDREQVFVGKQIGTDRLPPRPQSRVGRRSRAGAENQQWRTFCVHSVSKKAATCRRTGRESYDRA